MRTIRTIRSDASVRWDADGDVRPTALVIGADAGALLLQLARTVVEAAVRGRPCAAGSLLPVDPPAVLLEPAAAFVTLHEDGELRGCIGSLAADRPLWLNVVSAAGGAAIDDPRFAPVAPNELGRLSIDVSVLGRPVPFRDAEAFRPGVDGLIVERGSHRGLLLPEVATDQGWGAIEMLEGTCWKARLPPDAWRDPGTLVLAFRTARVSEAGAGVGGQREATPAG